MFFGARSRRETRALATTDSIRSWQDTGPSILAADLRMRGNIACEGELHVDGEVEGDITARSLTIGLAGRVSGVIEVDDLVVYGHVVGSVRAKRVHLAQRCKVRADIAHDVLSVDEGATFEGECRRVVDDQDDVGVVYDALTYDDGTEPAR